MFRSCSDPEVDSSDDKKLGKDMYEDAMEEEESDAGSYIGSIEIGSHKESMLSIWEDKQFDDLLFVCYLIYKQYWDWC